MKIDLLNGEYDILHVSSQIKKSNSIINLDIDSFMNTFGNVIKKLKYRKNKLLISFDGDGDIILNIELFKEVYKRESFIKDKFSYIKIDYSITTSIPNKNILDIYDFVLKYGISLKVNYLLYSPLENVRRKYYPNNKVSVCEGLDYLNHFYKKNSNVVINYDFIDGVNDSERDLKRICELLNDYSIPIKFPNKNSVWIDCIHKNIPNLKIIV